MGMDTDDKTLTVEELAAQLRALNDIAAIRRLLAACCQTLDDGLFDAWAELYAEDGHFAVLGTRTRGRAEMRALIEPFQTDDLRGKHLISEPLIDLDGDVANATTDFAFVANDNRIAQTGRYCDVLRRGPDGWRVARREIVFTGSEPQGFGD